jgi:predicted ATPase/DNA-binding winged helix-turn-helix (wHTH) protein
MRTTYARVTPLAAGWLPGVGDTLEAAWARPPDDPDASFETGEAQGQALLFGRYRFVPHSRDLSADGVPIALGARALEVLAVLVEARGELVTKDELMERVWPTTIVEENNLQYQISSLRKVLGADRGLIRTVPGRGYRFVADLALARPRPAIGSRALSYARSSADVITLPPALAGGALPAPASGLVGRETHLVDLAALVSANRLVTLVGAGGIGKTRLALELARQLEPGFDAVWLVELGALSDPAHVPAAVASALGLSACPVSSAALAAAFGARRVLMVLDNCEHLIDAAADAAETLLHASSSVVVIATSREPLRAEGEWVYRAAPLDVPPEDEDDPQVVLGHSAVRLFMERTHAAACATCAGPKVAAAAAMICRRLDGVPLAIELAAARAAALGVEALAARLDERLSLLIDGRRTAPPRHQTLRATLDWSYELLSEPERAVMRRVSAFAGGFSLDAAVAASGFGEVDPAQVTDCIAGLVAKSLMHVEAGEEAPRYRLLETMRGYAFDKLRQSAELDGVLRHAPIEGGLIG